jgi:hypothetical protein
MSGSSGGAISSFDRAITNRLKKMEALTPAGDIDVQSRDVMERVQSESFGLRCPELTDPLKRGEAAETLEALGEVTHQGTSRDVRCEMQESKSDLPIVCTLTPAALRARRHGMLADLLRRAEDYEQLPQGYRLRFTPTGETLSVIARTVDAERQCCRFLRFGITVEPDEGPIFLELSGPPGTREFVEALLEA